jgi:predicted transcriptional regulator
MKNTLTDAILSIKPIYAEAIISGIKTVEFRKKNFKKNVEKIYIYSSSPTKMIIGYFTTGGIEKSDFFDYYLENDKGFALIIEKVVEFQDHIDPIEFIENFTAPQSYIYLEKSTSANKGLAQWRVK